MSFLLTRSQVLEALIAAEGVKKPFGYSLALETPRCLPEII